MILTVFSVFDSAADAYHTPWFQPTKAMGYRMFSQMVNDQNHPFSQFPNDYTLFKIGEYEDQNGEISPIVPQRIANGKDVKGKPDGAERADDVIEIKNTG